MRSLHAGVRVLQADLKAPAGQALLHQELAATDVLITSFRPSALQRLGLDWPALQDRHPALSLVRIVGGHGDAAETPGHDLTYQAEAGLLPEGELLPASLHADMAGALLASEAVLRALLARHSTGRGTEHEIALSAAARWLAMPRTWGLALPAGDVGGAHAGYRVYRCQDGRVALAALEPHFMARLCGAVGLPRDADPRDASTRDAIASFLRHRRREELDRWALQEDIPCTPSTDRRQTSVHRRRPTTCRWLALPGGCNAALPNAWSRAIRHARILCPTRGEPMKPFALDPDMTSPTGMFYPTGYVFALFPGEQPGRDAGQALADQGYADVSHAPPDAIQQHVVRTLGNADTPLPSVGAEGVIVRRIAEPGGAGAPRAADPPARGRQPGIAAGGTRASGRQCGFFYRRLIIEDLIPQPAP